MSKYINVNENLVVRVEIYGTTREFFIYDRIKKESNFLGSLDLVKKNDKIIYNEFLNIKDENDYNNLLNKLNWI